MDPEADCPTPGGAGRCRLHFGYSSRNYAKKNELKPWLHEEWCIPKPGAEFAADMEDVLEVYERPYGASYPVICLDETSKQLIKETRPSLPARPGDLEKTDHEYWRCGVADLFMMFESLTGQRHVEISQTRTRKDFARCVKLLVDEYYPASKKVVLVMDHLNTHAVSSLYETYRSEEALRLSNRLEIHYTPKHGSWLDMAEIEIGIMNRQCLGTYTSSIEEMKHKVSSWCQQRNAQKSTVNWQFTTADARIKLKSLYPVIE